MVAGHATKTAVVNSVICTSTHTTASALTLMSSGNFAKGATAEAIRTGSCPISETPSAQRLDFRVAHNSK